MSSVVICPCCKAQHVVSKLPIDCPNCHWTIGSPQPIDVAQAAPEPAPKRTIMDAAASAAETVASWSEAKQDYARRQLDQLSPVLPDVAYQQPNPALSEAVAALLEQYDFGAGSCLGVMSDGKACFKGSFLAKLEAVRAASSVPSTHQPTIGE